jgi:VWFA-related protein
MIRVSLVSLAAAWLLAAQAGAPQTPIFRSSADVVPLFVTVTDKTGRLATDLTRDDFLVFDNGKPQPLTVFDASSQPIRLIILIDLSGSMRGKLMLFREATAALIAGLMPGDLAKVGTFGHDIQISPEFTRDARTLLASLPVDMPPNAPTPLWTTVDRAITEFGTGPAGRRVILVFSDGKDGGPAAFGGRFLSPVEIGDRAQREDVMIYGVGVRSAIQLGPGGMGNMTQAMADTFPDPGLARLAEESGGGYFELRPRDDLTATFARVADELHRQYLLGFATPARDGKTHKVEVRMRDKNLKPRARKMYVAAK